MNITAYIRYLLLLRKTKPRRYCALFKTIHRNACRRIIEIGVYDGIHAMQMIQTATVCHPIRNIQYFGFDLFEDLTDDLLKKEGAKPPLTYDIVQRRLEKTGADIRLFKGDTRITLPRFFNDIGKVDFIFIDGGHSVETINSDWNYVKELMGKDTIAIFDDYYINKDSAIDGLGCQIIVDTLDDKIYDVDILEPMDVFRKDWGCLKIKMAKVKKRGNDI